MTTVIGLVTFGNIDFTKLAVRSIRETYTGNPDDLEIAMVVGKPGDEETLQWAKDERVKDRHFHWMSHTTNRGFAASCNDLWDFALTRGRDNLIIVGNDVIAYPGAIDAMIATARDTDWEWICASQFDVKSLINHHPEAKRYFTGENLLFKDFDSRPWDLHLDAVHAITPEIRGGAMCDVQNLCLFKRSVHDKIGYFDANYWPGGYFSDNDYCRCGVLAGVKGCQLPNAAYFHFWSRTIHQGSGSTTDKNFGANEGFYSNKWGGLVGGEKWILPFQGQSVEVSPGVSLPGTLKIPNRRAEDEIVKFWQTRPWQKQ